VPGFPTPPGARRTLIIGIREVRTPSPATLCLVACLLASASVGAQSGPEASGHDLEVWTSSGYSGKGGVRNIGVWDAGFRYGWVFTDLHGPSFLRGRFEYAVEVAPLFLIHQPARTSYGFGLTPIVLQWEFQERRHIVPYYEMSGGPLFTSNDVPRGISQVNFQSGGAFGFHFLREKYNWSAELRFQHISDAGLTNPNPGINTVQVRIGFGIFTRPK
jgi:hypothetical protein